MCSLDGAEFTACTSPVSYTEADLRGTELSALGEHSFEVQATNKYGFVEDPPAIREWIIDDQHAPETTIDSGPAADHGEHDRDAHVLRPTSPTSTSSAR